jgi:hypothetical protein
LKNVLEKVDLALASLLGIAQKSFAKQTPERAVAKAGQISRQPDRNRVERYG